ncbi:nuclear transport factor 2 family protein [Flavobacterium alkalisoli]|uniref:Nuclear transport factor 2 family protein n=1 Tax=Flavobacterium alkalisoli TaxID=2602769 RepID=A0A5B9G0D0_9FLAO|nr:nuclear transport factor 2 family protein [Flavobacterium alkalisoli]QEE50517.1 nuclear transport factor 2 family protein [Flavobacterium alkalisoli]
MRKIFLLVFVLCTTGLFAQDKEIKKAIDVFFEGLNSKDVTKIKSVCDEGLKLQSVNQNDKGEVSLTTDEAAKFFAAIAAVPNAIKLEEKLLEYKIQYDGAMAHVWTPYEFYVDGKLSHKGVNSFQLFNDNGVWKIVYIIDTRKRA